MKVRARTVRSAFTLVEMALVLCVLLVLIYISTVGSGWIKKWKLGRTAGEHRRQLVADARAAVAQLRPERLGDERRLRPVLHVVRDERQEDGQERQRRVLLVEQREVRDRPRERERRASRDR